MQSKKIIAFDFDGVLINTIDMSVSVSQRMDKAMTRDRYLRNHEGNVFKMFNTAKDSVVDFFTEYQKGLRHHEITPEFVQLIQTLAKQYSLTIVSSTPSAIITEYLSQKNLRNYFGSILGGDVSPDKAQKLQMICSEFGCGPDSLIFITDTLGDIKEANRAGVPTIGVTWGIHPEATLRKGRVVAIVHTVPELVAQIETLRYH